MTVMDHWTGASATALRLAMRMTHEGFADTLGVSVRAVKKWRARPDIKVSPLYQQVLDTVLGRIDDSTQQRFAMLYTVSPENGKIARAELYPDVATAEAGAVSSS